MVLLGFGIGLLISRNQWKEPTSSKTDIMGSTFRLMTMIPPTIATTAVSWSNGHLMVGFTRNGYSPMWEMDITRLPQRSAGMPSLCHQGKKPTMVSTWF